MIIMDLHRGSGIPGSRLDGGSRLTSRPAPPLFPYTPLYFLSFFPAPTHSSLDLFSFPALFPSPYPVSFHPLSFPPCSFFPCSFPYCSLSFLLSFFSLTISFPPLLAYRLFFPPTFFPSFLLPFSSPPPVLPSFLPPPLEPFS